MTHAMIKPDREVEWVMDKTACPRSFKVSKTHGRGATCIHQLGVSYSVQHYSSLRLPSISESKGISKEQYGKRAVRKAVLDERRS